MFTISAFGDEISTDLESQVRILNELEIPGLDVRKAWGKNVLKFSDEDANQVRQICDDHAISIPCLGSPVGKSPLTDPIQNELNNLARLYQLADILGTRNIRIFSFYPDDTSTNSHYDQHLDETVERLSQMAESAQKHGFVLLLENEKGIVGDTVSRCRALMADVQNDYLRFLWDPANFVQVGEDQVTVDGWPLLSEYIGYIHIKDATLADKRVCPAGEGDGQIAQLLTHLKASGYEGTLSLEPHLASAGHSGGYSGPDGIKVAVGALRKVMAETGCEEDRP
ncbi:MAG: sugar phosphate isomerase/epimerase family protein [Chloroflexota bacterium]